MKVFVVHMQHPESSSDWIEGIFTTKEKADACYTEAFKKDDGNIIGDIEEYEIDKSYTDERMADGAEGVQY